MKFKTLKFQNIFYGTILYNNVVNDMFCNLFSGYIKNTRWRGSWLPWRSSVIWACCSIFNGSVLGITTIRVLCVIESLTILFPIKQFESFIWKCVSVKIHNQFIFLIFKIHIFFLCLKEVILESGPIIKR